MSGGYRLAIVVPRYGPEVNGGAESLAREYAQRLAPHVDVTVLTTCALDYRSWANHFAPGEHRDGPVRVMRFTVDRERDDEEFDSFSADVLRARRISERDARRWMDLQGPIAYGLEEHLATHGSTYDAVLFIPYLYATTYRALPSVADRAVLVPALHDEPPLRLPIFDEMFRSSQRIICSTPEEADLVRARFRVPEDRIHLVGAGIDPAPDTDASAFAPSLGIDRPYILSLGRIDPSKGSGDLIRHHAAYRSTRPYGPDLVMLGRSVMDVPAEPWLHVTGFVDDDTKHAAIAGCTALASASPFESLSLVLLEAWAHGRPTIVTSASDVLVGQTRRSGGGLWFDGAAEYGALVDLLTSRPPLAWGLGRAGWRFSRGLTWDSVIARLLDALPSSPVPA